MAIEEYDDGRGAGGSLPGLARVAGTSAINTAGWSLGMWLRTSRRLLRAVRDPEEAQALARDLGVAVTSIAELGRLVATGTPLPEALAALGDDERADPQDVREQRARELRAQGQQLLARSRDVTDDDGTHPAYERILRELAPDEARILMLLHEYGAQASVDVRTGGPAGMVSPELVAAGLSMVGARAGVRHLDQVPAYLGNLHRLGLVELSREPLHDTKAYQVLEAQPDVLEALRSVTFAKVVRRSIGLTPLGRDFCAACLADD